MGAKFLTLRILDILAGGWGIAQVFSAINSVKGLIIFSIFIAYAGMRWYYEVRFKENRLRKEDEEYRRLRDGLNGHSQGK